MITVSHQIENINKEKDIIKMNQIQILILAHTVTEVKNSLEGHKNNFEPAEERNKFEDKSIITIHFKEQEENEINKNKPTLKDMWDIH